MDGTENRVHVGWYCDHADEPMGEGSHMSFHGKYKKKGGWVETFPEPAVQRAMTFLNFHNPGKQPHCKKAVPLFVTKEGA